MFPIAPEGRLFVVGTAWLAVLTLLVGYTAAGIVLVCFAIVLLLLFRNFAPRVPGKALGVLAPVDGVVQTVDEAPDPFTGGQAHRIVIRQRALGEYNVHAPQEATVIRQCAPGRGLDEAADPQLAGRFTLAFATDEGLPLSLAVDRRRRPGFVRIGAANGSRIGRGKRLGFAGFGVDAILWLPIGARVSVRPGQAVKAGADLLGDLPSLTPQVGGDAG